MLEQPRAHTEARKHCPICGGDLRFNWVCTSCRKGFLPDTEVSVPRTRAIPPIDQPPREWTLFYSHPYDKLEMGLDQVLSKWHLRPSVRTEGVVAYETIAFYGPDPGRSNRPEYRGTLVFANDGILMAVKKGRPGREKPSDSIPEFAREFGGEIAGHAIMELGGPLAALALFLAESAHENTRAQKQWAQMLDDPNTFAIPAPSITRMEVKVYIDFRGKDVWKFYTWLAVTSENETGQVQQHCFGQEGFQRVLPRLWGTPAINASYFEKDIPSKVAHQVSLIWEVRFRYELFWLIWQQLFHYLPRETPFKVLADWLGAWRSRAPLAPSVSALNAIIAAVPNVTSKPVQRYEDMVKQAFYRLQRFRAVPSIAEVRAPTWADLENAPICPVCFSCWAPNSPHTKTCVSCGGALQ